MIRTTFLTLLLASTTFAAEPDKDGFVPLFNGKDLSGWVNVNCHPDTFFVKDGMIICNGHPNGVMRTEKEYENFILHVEWMHMEAGGNSGVFVWSEGKPALPKPLPKGCEVQMLELEWPKLNPDKDKNSPSPYNEMEISQEDAIRLCVESAGRSLVVLLREDGLGSRL